METREQLVGLIKDWIECDNRINEVQRMAKEHKENKKRLTLQLVKVMKDHEIDCFDINNGKIIYSQNKVKSGLNKKHLLTCLSKYFENSDNPELANDITKFILESRETKIKDNIKMK